MPSPLLPRATSRRSEGGGATTSSEDAAVVAGLGGAAIAAERSESMTSSVSTVLAGSGPSSSSRAGSGSDTERDPVWQRKQLEILALQEANKRLLMRVSGSSGALSGDSARTPASTSPLPVGWQRDTPGTASALHGHDRDSSETRAEDSGLAAPPAVAICGALSSSSLLASALARPKSDRWGRNADWSSSASSRAASATSTTLVPAPCAVTTSPGMPARRSLEGGRGRVEAAGTSATLSLPGTSSSSRGSPVGRGDARTMQDDARGVGGGGAAASTLLELYLPEAMGLVNGGSPLYPRKLPTPHSVCQDDMPPLPPFMDSTATASCGSNHTGVLREELECLRKETADRERRLQVHEAAAARGREAETELAEALLMNRRLSEENTSLRQMKELVVELPSADGSTAYKMVRSYIDNDLACLRAERHSAEALLKSQVARWQAEVETLQRERAHHGSNAQVAERSEDIDKLQGECARLQQEWIEADEASRRKEVEMLDLRSEMLLEMQLQTHSAEAALADFERRVEHAAEQREANVRTHEVQAIQQERMDKHASLDVMQQRLLAQELLAIEASEVHEQAAEQLQATLADEKKKMRLGMSKKLSEVTARCSSLQEEAEASAGKAKDTERQMHAKLADARKERQRVEGKLKNQLQVLQRELASQARREEDDARAQEYCERFGEAVEEVERLHMECSQHEAEVSVWKQRHDDAVKEIHHGAETFQRELHAVQDKSNFAIQAELLEERSQCQHQLWEKLAAVEDRHTEQLSRHHEAHLREVALLQEQHQRGAAELQESALELQRLLCSKEHEAIRLYEEAQTLTRERDELKTDLASVQTELQHALQQQEALVAALRQEQEEQLSRQLSVQQSSTSGKADPLKGVGSNQQLRSLQFARSQARAGSLQPVAAASGPGLNAMLKSLQRQNGMRRVQRISEELNKLLGDSRLRLEDAAEHCGQHEDAVPVSKWREMVLSLVQELSGLFEQMSESIAEDELSTAAGREEELSLRATIASLEVRIETECHAVLQKDNLLQADEHRVQEQISELEGCLRQERSAIARELEGWEQQVEQEASECVEAERRHKNRLELEMEEVERQHREQQDLLVRELMGYQDERVGFDAQLQRMEEAHAVQSRQLAEAAEQLEELVMVREGLHEMTEQRKAERMRTKKRLQAAEQAEESAQEAIAKTAEQWSARVSQLEAAELSWKEKLKVTREEKLTERTKMDRTVKRLRQQVEELEQAQAAKQRSLEVEEAARLRRGRSAEQLKVQSEKAEKRQEKDAADKAIAVAAYGQEFEALCEHIEEMSMLRFTEEEAVQLAARQSVEITELRAEQLAVAEAMMEAQRQPPKPACLEEELDTPAGATCCRACESTRRASEGLQRRIWSLEANLQDSSQDQKALVAEKELLEDQLRLAASQLEALLAEESKDGDLQRELAGLSRQFEVLHGKHRTQLQKVAEQSRQLQKEKQAKKELEARLQTLTMRYDEELAASTQLREEEEQASQEKVAVAKQRGVARERELQEARCESSALTCELSRLRSLSQQQALSSKALQDEIGRLQGELARKHLQLDEAQKELRQFGDSNSQLEAARESLKQRQLEVQQMRVEHARLQGATKLLQVQLRSLEAERAGCIDAVATASLLPLAEDVELVPGLAATMRASTASSLGFSSSSFAAPDVKSDVATAKQPSEKAESDDGIDRVCRRPDDDDEGDLPVVKLPSQLEPQATRLDTANEDPREAGPAVLVDAVAAGQLPLTPDLKGQNGYPLSPGRADVEWLAAIEEMTVEGSTAGRRAAQDIELSAPSSSSEEQQPPQASLPASAREAFRRAEECCDRQEYAEAVPLFRVVLKTLEEPSSKDSVPAALKAEVWAHLGVAMQSLDRVPEAIDAYKRAVQLEPSLHVCFANLAALHAYLHDFDQAEGYVQQALTLEPGNPTYEQIRRGLRKHAHNPPPGRRRPPLDTIEEACASASGEGSSGGATTPASSTAEDCVEKA
eukprot:TRINITY_DN12350_c0_g2_i2.p1 TRINITY_DN12350_c0_g2~~TRINITY_DN12350_c0_g2_i2.p1  ORF type:complete len:1985 (+),score=659.24 TRINITY_DN12350_c0_g2_i2:230-6184(+)